MCQMCTLSLYIEFAAVTNEFDWLGWKKVFCFIKQQRNDMLDEAVGYGSNVHEIKS